MLDAEYALSKVVSEIAQTSRSFPQVWNRIEDCRRARPLHVKNLELLNTHWPTWCYLPFLIAEHADPLQVGFTSHSDFRSKMSAIDAAYSESRIDGPRAASRSLLLECLLYGGWRQTKGVYVFDPDLGKSLWSTSPRGKIPREIITRLPEWSVFLTLPEGAFQQACDEGERAIAALCQINKISTYDSLIFKIIFSTGMSATLSMPLFDTLDESIDFMEQCLDSPENKFSSPDGTEIRFDNFPSGIDFAAVVYRRCQQDVQGLISTLLYLCSEEPDVSGRVKPAVPVKTKRGPRIFPAEKATIIHVGLRVGAAIRHSERQERPAPEPGQPVLPHRTSPRPHLRSAHWHLYWTGPRNNPVPRVKWLPPIAVGVHLGEGELEPVAHPVL